MITLDDGTELSLDEIMSMESDGISYTMDGCIVEPDGTCEHGKESVLLVLGVI